MGLRSILFRELTEEDVVLSGPHVWPNIDASLPIDRFIHRRPELAYLVAKKRMHKARRKKGLKDDAPLINVRFRRNYWERGRIERNAGHKFGHMIDYDDEIMDVKQFLQNLRRNVNRYMPNKPLFNCSLQLLFFDYQFKNEQLLSWQEKWL